MRTTALTPTVSALAALLLSATPTRADDPNADVLLAPPELLLAGQTPGATIHRSVWLVNTGRESLELQGARGTCGCTAVDFTPGTLPPRSALEVPLRIVASGRAGHGRSVRVAFTIEGRPPLHLPVRIETAGGDASPAGDVVAEAEPVRVAPGQVVRASARLVNTGGEPRTVQAAGSSCGGTRVVGFAPFTLPPGESAEVAIDVDAPPTVGADVARELTFVVEDQGAVKVPVRVRTDHAELESWRSRLRAAMQDAHELGDVTFTGEAVTALAWNEARQPVGRVHLALADGAVGRARFESLVPVRRGAT